ncbi:probable sodium-coupled neutral amino acid transporter 6 [Spodoptera litura]|uniref:Probable sodium-coupled neutral amino acid transporter 6 n=1 Tax=Spodoptera litura TaxID=69820 RepID=A0A9J7IKD9_SPOLT|nr:probable sodium-coupled neutral amino acid transporter 6 [Spodoptera litura]XP_022818472.1 probable sodium-coupled neutral amino acid transporter 6 [Spodoptera litura]
MKFPAFLDKIPGLGYSKPTTLVTRHDDYTVGETTGGLSVLFTILCIVDLFGVFPVITLPKSVISCGIYGLPLVLSVFGLQLYTAVLLGKSWLLAQKITPDIKEKNRFPYAAVAELAFGAPAKRLVTFLIDAAVFGSGVPNFIIASQTLQIFWWKISGGEIGITYCVWMVILGLLLCPVMWLGSPKDMKPIAITSVIIVTTVAITTWTCILRDDTSPMPTSNVVDLEPQLQEFLIAYGILAFQFDIHPMLLTLQVDMKDSKKINSAVLGGFGITGCMFAITAVLSAFRYGTDLDNNILQSIPSSIPLYLMSLLVTLQLCLSSAVSHSALFQHIEDLMNIPRDFCFQRCLIRSSIVAVGVILAESVPRFDLVMGLVGSTLTGPLMFICPPVFFLKLCYMKSKMSPKHNPFYKLLEKQNRTQNGSSHSQNGGTKGDSLQNGGTQNDSSQDSQNGDLSKSPLIYVGSSTKYKTFTDYAIEIMKEEDEYAIKWYDVVLALIVMTIGVVATIVATYSSWANSIAYATFSPPCLMNATEAARSFLQLPMSV